MTGDSNWLRRIGSSLRPHLGWVLAGVGSAAAAQLINALAPLVTRHVIDSAVGGRHEDLRPWIALLLLAGAARFLLSLAYRYAAGLVSLRVQYDLRTSIFSHLQRLDFARHDELQTGQVVSRSISDLNAVQQLLNFLPLMLAQLVFALAAIGIMFYLSFLLGLVAIAAVPLMALVSGRLRQLVYPANWDAQQRAAVVAGVVEETVTGVRIVKGYGQEERELKRLARQAALLFGSRMRTIRLRARYSAVLAALPALAQVAMLAVGGWLAIGHHVSIGTFLICANYVTQLQTPARLLSGLFVQAQQGRASAERIFALLDSTPKVEESEQARNLDISTGLVEFDRVGFGYLRSEPVLDSFSLRVEPGETVALVGGAGSGKSTVAMLLPRFYDVQSGAIRIDGSDVRDFTLNSLRSQIGAVFEDPFLFSESVRFNIAYGRPDADMERVVAAAKAAEAHTFIMELAHGYETRVGEQGLSLSGGQRQRIALARALLTDPRILVLDDATSAIDAQMEREIQATLRRLCAGRTVLLVARRRSSLRLADRIALVESGRLEDIGTHLELMNRSQRYRLMMEGGDEEGAEIDADAAALVLNSSRPTTTTALWSREGTSDQLEAMRVAGRLGTVVGGSRGGGGIFSSSGAVLTPGLEAGLDALPPIVDAPDISIADASTNSGRFRFPAFLGRWKWQLLVGFSLVVLDALAELLGPVLIQNGIDRGVERAALGTVLLAALAFLIVVLADLVVSLLQIFITGRTAERALYALRVKIFAHLQRLSLSYYDSELSGRVMTRMTSDVEALTQLIQQGLVTALTSLITSLGVVVVLLALNFELGLAVLALTPALLVGTQIFRIYSARAYGEARERVAVVNAHLQEGVSGIRVTQAFVRERRNQERFNSISQDLLSARLRAQLASSTFFPYIQLCSDLATALVLLLGTGLLLQGHLSAGVLIAAVLYTNLFFSPIQQLSQVLDSYQQAAVALSRIRELLAIPTLTPESARPTPLPSPMRGEIEFDSVSFRYPGTSADALRGVDLHIGAGETVAFVGPTGAGKSTVLKLVARFYDATSGAVRVDGVDVRQLELGAYRRRLGVVPQEPFLFAGTIRDNIAYGRPESSDAEVEAAARAVGAHDVVAGLPGGYLHLVGERGRTLSIGQRQLLALARALLVDPRILLLDEATSNLDLSTEARVTRAMSTVAAGRTTLLIAHRLASAAPADRIYVIDGGRVAEVGRHSELLLAGGLYARSWAASEAGARG
ncbi:MAG TPA: ABC transporter ATP-binding protein [Candidatus Acidoferrales bacterium]|nr:ABC transporter ATP-binding protein [Candidatus Acidoferrales bacterium]